MKNKLFYTLGIVLCFVATLTSCTKDVEQTFTALTQSYQSDNGSKAFISNNYACWSNGDAVKINGTNCSVSLDISNNKSTATITNVPKSNTGYYAIYPASYCDASFGNGATITLPSQISYQSAQGNQILLAPMAAKADDENLMLFKNLCTILKVHVPPVNNILYQIKIKALSSGVALSGSGIVTFDGAGEPTLGTISGGNTIILDCGTGVSVAQGGDFFIPIPPVPNNTRLRITVIDKFGQEEEREIVASNDLPANAIIQVASPTIHANNNYDFFDWIWSRGSGYIDLGIKPNNTSKFEITFSLTNATCSQYLTGSRSSDEFQWFTLTGPASTSDDTKKYFQGTLCANQAQNTEANGGWRRETNKKYRETMIVKHNSSGYYGEVVFENLTDGLTNSQTTGTHPTGITSSAPNVILFGIRPTQLHLGMKCYQYRLWSDENNDGESELIADFVPAQRKSDNAIGFYDMKTGTFILPTPKAGATPFSLGND